MGFYECDLDGGTFFDYREKITVSDHDLRCCETGVDIPAGTPYALCSGVMYEFREWGEYPQCLEVWRLLRAQKRKDGTCFAFMETGEAWREGSTQEERLFWVAYDRICKRGTKPRLHEWERKALYSGEWFDWVEYPPSLRFRGGKPYAAANGFGEIWVPCSLECIKCAKVWELDEASGETGLCCECADKDEDVS